MDGGRQWFEDRLATIPSALQERLRADIAPLAPFDTANAVADALVDIVQRRVQSMWDTGACAERADALDLLSIDALVTYAIGFVAEHLPGDLEAYTTRLLCAVAGVTRALSPRLA